MQPEQEIDYEKPVAYTPEGQPLYARPSATAVPVATGPGAPQVVYLSRAISPHQQEISPEIQQRHDESARKYPQLNLSEGEYVISAVRRHPIGLISIWIVVVLAVILLLAIPVIILATESLPFALTAAGATSGAVFILLGVVLLLFGGIVATVVYDANRFYLTNESVTQYIQTGLFFRKNQTISLGNIEDASYNQRGILQTIFNYGAIRLSTEGEETTYRFTFVANPQKQARYLNDAIEAFKNFRPINDES